MVDVNYILDSLSSGSTLENMLQGDIILIESSADILDRLAPVLLSELVSQKNAIVLLSGKGYFDFVPLLSSKDVDLSKIFFVDCISRSSGLSLPDNGHVVDLTSISQLKIVFSSLLDKADSFAGDSFVAFESLNSLAKLYKSKDFVRFLHILLTKLRNKNVGCLLLSVKDDLIEDLRADMVQLFDSVLHF